MEATQAQLDLAADSAINCYHGLPRVQALIDEYRVDNINGQSIGDKIRAMRLLCHPGDHPGPLTDDDIRDMSDADKIIIPGVILKTIFPFYDVISRNAFFESDNHEDTSDYLGADRQYAIHANTISAIKNRSPLIQPNPYLLNQNEKIAIRAAHNNCDQARADFNSRNIPIQNFNQRMALDESRERLKVACALVDSAGPLIGLEDTRAAEATARAVQLPAVIHAVNAPGIFNKFAVETPDEAPIVPTKTMKTGEGDEDDEVTKNLEETFGNFHIGGKKTRRSKKYKNKRSKKYEIMRGMLDVAATLRISGNKTTRSRKSRKNHKKNNSVRRRR